MRRLRAFAAALAALAALAPSIAGACAALFSPDAEVRQAAQRIIFTVDQAAGQVSAYVAVSYTGEAEDFAWVVPMPSNPTVEVVEPEIFSSLDFATRPRYLFPDRDCRSWISLGGASAPESAGGAPGGVQVFQQGQVGPYDFSVVGGDDAGELTGWLRQNGYAITPPMEPLIKIYTDERMLFLAMKLQGDRETGDIKPVKMTFQAEKAMIPLRLAAVGAEPDTELAVWVFADQQVAPENMERIVIPDEQVVVESYNGGSTYDDVVTSALAAADGHGLVVEYALPTDQLEAGSDPLLAELKGRHRFLTRFYGRFSPEQMTVDPTFAPQEGLEEISNVHDLTGRVHPYDCNAREVLPPGEQVVAAGSLPGMWIQSRWIAFYCVAPLLIVVGLGWLALRLLRRGRAAAQ